LQGIISVVKITLKVDLILIVDFKFTFTTARSTAKNIAILFVINAKNPGLHMAAGGRICLATKL